MNKNRRIFLALVAVMLVILAVVIVNRLDRPQRMDAASEEVNIEIKYKVDGALQPVNFVDDVMLLQTDEIVVTFSTAETVKNAVITIEYEDRPKETYAPEGGITTEMQKSGNYELEWKLSELPPEGIMVIGIEMGGEEKSYQTDFISNIPDLKNMFLQNLDVFNLELNMENLKIGKAGEVTKIDGLDCVKLEETGYGSLDDMDNAVSGLFSADYISEYHGFFDEYYYFVDGELYKVRAEGIQTAPLVYEEQILDIVYEKIKTDKCELKCMMKDGEYELIFVLQDDEWRLDSFVYDKKTAEDSGSADE